MAANWKLFYKQDDTGEMQFAELLNRDVDKTLRKGAAFTHGEVEDVDDFDAASQQLLGEGYQLQREWTFDRTARDYDQFVREIQDVISAAPDHADTNALAIITDSSFMTVGIAFHQFDDIDSADDEQLWIVDEWDTWHEDWQLDPAYRWLLAYGYHDDVADKRELFDESREKDRTVFHDRVRQSFQDILKSCRDTKDILLIYIGGDDIGAKWSAECMDAKYGQRYMEWC